MMNVPENELFSAYLDGELTAQEQAQVERLLATSPAARQLLEELRTLSTGLQNLPSHELEEDLSERVLRAAERRILSGPEDLGSRDALPQPAKPQPASIARRLLRPRALLWSAVAVAVAVVLVLREREEQVQRGPDRVAMAPEAAKGPGPGPSIRAAGQEALEAPHPEADAVVEKPTPPVPEETVVAEEEPIGEMMPGKAGAGDMPKAAPAEPSGPSAAGEPLAPAPTARDVADGAEVSAPLMPPEVVSSSEVEARPAVAADKKDESVPLPSGAVAKQVSPAAEPVGQPGEQPKPAAGSPLLVFHCNVTSEAARQGLLNQILAERQIELVETADRSGRGVAEAEKIGRGAEPSTLEVETTPKELLALLADLKSRPEEFLALSADPGPARVILQVAGSQNGRSPAIQSFGTLRFRGTPARSTAPSVGVGAASGAVSAGRPEATRAQGLRVQVRARSLGRTPAPADQTVGVGAAAASPGAMRAAKLQPAKPARAKLTPKGQKGSEAKAVEGQRGEQGPTADNKRVVRAGPRVRVRFVLRVVEPPAPAAEQPATKKTKRDVPAATEPSPKPAADPTADGQ